MPLEWTSNVHESDEHFYRGMLAYVHERLPEHYTRQSESEVEITRKTSASGTFRADV